jgi:hypothetical protein
MELGWKVMLISFVVLQIVLLLFMVFHDWIPLPPLNDITALRLRDNNLYRLTGSVVNGAMVVVPLTLSLTYYGRPIEGLRLPVIITVCYALLTLGTLLSWWVPYLFGSSQGHKEQFDKFKNTHHFLPARGENVVPNTLHVLLHLQVWACLAMACYLLVSKSR